MIFKSERRIPFRRRSLICSMASPRTKLPNSAAKRPSRRTARIQKRRLGLIIVVDRGWRAAFKGGDAGGAQGFERHEPDGAFAAFAVQKRASALHVLEERALFGAVEVPEAIVMLVDLSHLDRLPFGGDVKPLGEGGGASISLRTTIATRLRNNLRVDIGPLPAILMP
jgi:hypothetical protein